MSTLPTISSGFETDLKERYAAIRRRLRFGGAVAEPRPRDVVERRLVPWPLPRPMPEARPRVEAPAPRPPSAVDTLPEFHTIADRIIAEVADKHGLTVHEVKSTRRKAQIIDARYEAFHRVSKETPMSLPQIGRKFGGYDHTTVLHGIRTHEARLNGSTRKWHNPTKPREPVWGVGGWR